MTITRTTGVLLVWGLAACVAAQEAAIEDGGERDAWTVRPDGGAHYLKLSQDPQVGAFGDQSLRLDVTIDPQNQWWSVITCAVGENPDPDQYDGLRVAVRTSAALPSGGLTAKVGDVERSPELKADGQWQYIDVKLPDKAAGGVGVELNIKHGIPGLPAEFTLHIDGPAWAQSIEADTRITRLKPLHLDTALVEAGQPRAVIVAPPGDRYQDAVETVQAAVQARTGVTLPVVRDQALTARPEELLQTRNVIALGNMATNPFTEEMYRKWYVLLDLRYPGPGGHVVRSLHDPCGTGHNVIWVGGSDDEGVLSAARVFAELLKGEKEDSLAVGWLMKIKLGEGITPPKLDLDANRFDVRSWRDSFRERGGRKTGYDPSTFFGWNPISVAGVLYYMTGDSEYLDAFKAMAMPDPDNMPRPNVSDDAFNDPMDPLVKNYHYRAHLVDCVYDLIEESPLFTDEERLFLTNKLLEHQNHFDPGDCYCESTASRHSAWHMICIYTGSRYFDKYYPDPRWAKRMDNTRRAFANVFGNATWGEGDTLCWVDTSMEPVFEFFMLDGFDEFVASGTAGHMMGALETLWTNTAFEESTEYRPMSLLHKAAYMLGDGRFIWMRDRLGFDLDRFRIGQSFWPPPDLPVEPPEDIVNTVSVFPLPPTRWVQSGKSVPLEEAFQFLAYRTGLTPDADMFQMDGFYGKSRTPYHVNALYTLYMYGGKRLLHRGYANQVTVRGNGMVEPVVPRAAAVKRVVALGDMAYVHTNVPNMAFSEWDRHLMYVPDSYAIVVDNVTGRATGNFDVTVNWAPRGTPAPDPEDPRRAVCPEGPVIQCAQPAQISCAPKSVSQTCSGTLAEGETHIFSNILYWSDGENEREFTMDVVGAGAHLIHGTHDAFVALGQFASDALATDAEVSYVSADRVFLVGATRLTCDGAEIVGADRPVSLLWKPKAGELTLEGGGQARPDVTVSPDAAAAISEALGALREQVATTQPTVGPEPEPVAEVNWRPVWEAELPGGAVIEIAVAPSHNPKGIWAATWTASAAEDQPATSSLSVIGLGGEVERSVGLDARVCSLWPAADDVQEEAFCILAGLRNDMIRAYSEAGEVVWEQKAAVHPSFEVGDHYDAPWFSDPRPPRDKRGVFAIMAGDLWGKGTQEIVLGRPVTLEFRALDGTLIERVATRWGDNASLAVLRERADDEKGPLLLTGRTRCGTARVSAVGEDHGLVSNRLYADVPPGATHMGAWMRRGVGHLQVADLDADGVEEIIVTRSGHWNELAVYSATNDLCAWMASFGPARSRSAFMAGMAVADLTGDDRQEIVVGMANGWVCAFDCAGEPLWQHHFPAAVRAMCSAQAASSVAVGCGDGFVHLMDGAGRITRTAQLASSVTALASGPGCLLAGTEAGRVMRLPLD